jgi:chemotaxis protein MotB
LNAQITTLRDQLSRIEAALDASEAKVKDQQGQIVELGKRLNLALVNKVEELARYRSEFFGRLREILGDRADIRIVGDRFVFQSEVLFAPGSADLGDDAKKQLAPVIGALKEIADKIPLDINWILRVDGHTDHRPISSSQFPSNWELSTARAISVVRFAIDEGVPANRLAAAGFADRQPLDLRNTEDAYRRNRRIELKLTER